MSHHIDPRWQFAIIHHVDLVLEMMNHLPLLLELARLLHHFQLQLGTASRDQEYEQSFLESLVAVVR
jgi:hypothetical protein